MSGRQPEEGLEAMSSDGGGSVTHWIGDLRAGDLDEAARRLGGCYLDQLARLARVHPRAAARGPADGEDVALSAFESFFAGAAAGAFPRLGGRDDLWRLLVVITARKAANLRRRERQLKRGSGHVFDEAALGGADPDAAQALARAVGDEPTPEFAALVAEECRRLLDGLRDETSRQVALLRMEGHRNEELAERRGIGLRSVERKLAAIRKRWQSEGGA